MLLERVHLHFHQLQLQMNRKPFVDSTYNNKGQRLRNTTDTVIPFIKICDSFYANWNLLYAFHRDVMHGLFFWQDVSLQYNTQQAYENLRY